MMAINDTIQAQLNLPFIEKRKAQMASGEVVEYEVVGPLMIKFANRTATCSAFALPGDSEPLLGTIPMKEMDVLIHPQRQELVVNPRPSKLCSTQNEALNNKWFAILLVIIILLPANKKSPPLSGTLYLLLQSPSLPNAQKQKLQMLFKIIKYWNLFCQILSLAQTALRIQKIKFLQYLLHRQQYHQNRKWLLL